MPLTNELGENASAAICAIVCTTGDRNTLHSAVVSLVEQTLAPERYAILVVLNRDDEKLRCGLETEFLALGAARNVRPRVVVESGPGLSHARNTGLRAANSEFVAFMDDDARAEPTWLGSILNCFRKDANIASVGGSILPLWEIEPPRWVKPPLHTYFSCRSFGDRERYLGKGEYFFGTNMAFRRDVLMECGGFPTNLGRKGDSLLSNEEWPVFRAIDARGLLKLASPEVRVLHSVPAARMTGRFFIRRLWWQGVSNTVFHLECEGRTRAWVARQAVRDFTRYYKALPGMLRRGHVTWRLAFFNLFRWLGIARALMKHRPQGRAHGAGHTVDRG